MFVMRLSRCAFLSTQIRDPCCFDKQVCRELSQTACLQTCPTQSSPVADTVTDLKAFSSIPGPKPLPLVGNIWRYAIGETKVHMFKLYCLKLVLYKCARV